ncbi:hypothetical protein [Natronoglycomyces albus]|uniref:Uncharacterized protein n=1 Tax=Natronoglycomyces albus TaxID=2811108 RepID=A0A895XTX6_9ACTN|nr:hypothetical protein [Natronoglycomyces albus]QSB05098.1 hypothetical protein JQS30_15270 [Natronoglycomyces albus]
MSTPDPVIIAHSSDNPKPDSPSGGPSSGHQEEQPAAKLDLHRTLVGQDLAFTSTTPPTESPKTTPDSVVEFRYNSEVFTVSPHPERGSALALRMRGQCMAIRVATILFARGRITGVEWETPFSGRPTEWQEALLAQAVANADPALREVG